MGQHLFQWNEDKNDWLKKTRGLSFELVVAAVHDGRVIVDVEHHSRPNQRIIIFDGGDYVCAAPYVTDGKIKFLKTVYKNRDLNETFGRK